MSPRSMIVFQPKSRSRAFTVSLAPASFPQTKTSWSLPARAGSTMTRQLQVFSVLTTLVLGSSRWSLSPSESVLQIVSVGGRARRQVERVRNVDEDLLDEILSHRLT